VPVPDTAATPVRTDAVTLAPNILSVAHWDRLLGGALYAATPRVDWAMLLRRSFEVDVVSGERLLEIVGKVAAADRQPRFGPRVSSLLRGTVAEAANELSVLGSPRFRGSAGGIERLGIEDGHDSLRGVPPTGLTAGS